MFGSTDQSIINQNGISKPVRKPTRVAVFISGSGSTLQALLEMQHQIEIVLVVSNKKSAFGLLKAKRFGKQTYIFSSRSSYLDLHEELKKNNIERIILAGFMKIIPKEFVDLWTNKMVNIHPSLLPAYPGLDSAERNWNDQNDMGVTLHYVTAEMDQGEIVKQQISLTKRQIQQTRLEDSMIFLRRTEQHLLRELTYWLN